jgi:hypothetical protein
VTGRSVELFHRGPDVLVVLLDRLHVQPGRGDLLVADRGDDDPRMAKTEDQFSWTWARPVSW